MCPFSLIFKTTSICRSNTLKTKLNLSQFLSICVRLINSSDSFFTFCDTYITKMQELPVYWLLFPVVLYSNNKHLIYRRKHRINLKKSIMKKRTIKNFFIVFAPNKQFFFQNQPQTTRNTKFNKRTVISRNAFLLHYVLVL